MYVWETVGEIPPRHDMSATLKDSEPTLSSMTLSCCGKVVLGEAMCVRKEKQKIAGFYVG